MKNIICLMVCIMGIALISCQKEDPEPKKKTGTLHIDIGVPISVNEMVPSYKAVPVIEEFNVNIYAADGTVVFTFENVTDLPENIELETGDYYVEAYSDNDLPADFENPYYYGLSGQFTISSNTQQDVQVNCELANTMVTVVYSDNIINDFTGYTTTVSSSLGSLVFTSVETRTGYFQTSPLDILVELSYQKPDGTLSNKSLSGSIPEPLANRHYEIMVDATIDAGMATFQILMDESAVAMEVIDISDNSPIPQTGAVAYGELLITEIMANPSALSDTEGEWFEIYNNSDHNISLQNLILERDDINNHTIADPVELASGEYLVLSRTDLATDAANEYVYGTAITLSNTGAVLAIYNEGTETDPGALIFSLNYGEASFPDGTGASICLNPNLTNATDALLGASWCISTSLYSTGDSGTPGTGNDLCQ
ncbi:MAG: DUF4493 domain-containing protein [Bacteroidetes bacterium]|nr:DUF4493 domain-containing protein [Bacteroidota bacterium]